MSLFKKKDENQNAASCSCGDDCDCGCKETGVCDCGEECDCGCKETEVCDCGDDCNCGCKETGVCDCGDTKPAVKVKILGSGCKSCHALFDNAKQAVDNMGLNAEVEHISDMQIVMKYGVMSTPALVINEKVVSMGKVLKSAEITELLKKIGE